MIGIISYAQNFEDVMLWRALSHIKNGCYIDIGANDPIIDSVSLAFHERGWRGIHVEPIHHYAELLRQQRPGDQVIQAVVGEDTGLIKFFEIAGTGISTADPVIAQRHRECGFDVQESNVQSIKLSTLFKSCYESEIHWLKIDVEGFEKQVLSSWGNAKERPWVIVVESTLPLTQIETYKNWESILFGYGYSFVYFDGLNRYYLSDKNPELKSAFLAPPNIFDDFTVNGTASNSFHRLIDTRYKQKINEIITQHKQENVATDNEVKGLSLNLASLAKTSAESELALTQQLQAAQLELSRVEQERVKRELLLCEQIGLSQQQTENLLRALAQREQEVATQLITMQSEHAERELALIQHNDAVLKNNFEENNRLLEACAAVEAQLKIELEAEQQINLELNQSLIHIQQRLAAMYASLTWRMTSPLRRFATVIVPKKNSTHRHLP